MGSTIQHYRPQPNWIQIPSRSFPAEFNPWSQGTFRIKALWWKVFLSPEYALLLTSEVVQKLGQHTIQFVLLSEPGKPGVRSLGPDVRQ